MQYFFILHTLILHTLELFSRVLLCTELFYIPPFTKNQNMNGRHFYKFHRLTSGFTNFSMHSTYFMKTLKITRMLVSRITAATKLLKICLSNGLSTLNFLSVEYRCPVAILLVYISLATVTSSTVTSSKRSVENSAKARYVDVTHSYCFLKVEINKSNQRIL